MPLPRRSDAACSRRRTSTSATQILYQSTISDPRTFNPILVTDAASGEVVGDLFEGLVRINPITTLPEPGLAESWELSDGGKSITFSICATT